MRKPARINDAIYLACFRLAHETQDDDKITERKCKFLYSSGPEPRGNCDACKEGEDYEEHSVENRVFDVECYLVLHI